MTQDEIIEMAKQAGYNGPNIAVFTMQDLERFAKLVAQQAQAEEREACACIAFNGCLVPPDGGSPTEAERLMCEDIANAIRARGEASIRGQA